MQHPSVDSSELGRDAGASHEPSALLARVISATAQAEGGWIGFDEFMQLALYAPGLGYYSGELPKIGLSPEGGSDFATAPEMSPYFGRALARQVAQMLRVVALAGPAAEQSGRSAGCITEFGGGSGALAQSLIAALAATSDFSGGRPELAAHGWVDAQTGSGASLLAATELQQVAAISRPLVGLPRPLAGLSYQMVDISANLRERQRARLAGCAAALSWLDALPERLGGVLLGNEVLDAMPVKLLARLGGIWHERGVVWSESERSLQFSDKTTALRPPIEIEGDHDVVTEIHPQAEAFVATLADKLLADVAAGGGGGVALFIDYGFDEAQYYHPQRSMGTLMCHQAHRSGGDPLQAVGQQDITAHVNFTGIALAAQNAGLGVVGYTTQARFLMNCGMLGDLAGASLAERVMAQKLLTEHEMGELFKVVALCTPNLTAQLSQAPGFAQGDLTHKL